MSVRDAVIDLKRYPQVDGSIIYIVKSIDREDFPETKGTVRMDLWQGKRFSELNGKCNWCIFEFMDIKGYIPKSLFNMGLGSWKKKELLL